LGVQAATDVTGFGLLGHTLEMCRASHLGAEIYLSKLPLLPGAADLAQAGVATGAAMRNWISYGDVVTSRIALADWQRGMLCDPQTSGGLLIAAAPAKVQALLHYLHAQGFSRAAVIGTMCANSQGVTILG
jgi:selenide,water dikinase